jgi:hypothetical protein
MHQAEEWESVPVEWVDEIEAVAELQPVAVPLDKVSRRKGVSTKMDTKRRQDGLNVGWLSHSGECSPITDATGFNAVDRNYSKLTTGNRSGQV